ncbi:M20/M25/M40 family metallo-hydrolase [uncultured Sutterella sp.]|uniref:M20/M25/M40 family metallo-hydrolase n=1 Tax=uncultured Sutterella sp. TaxID=286133 RepID=UPI0034A094BA
MGGEDFAFYQEKVPGAMVLLGVRNEACDAVWPQHHGCYKVDESVLVKGAALHVQTALDLLGVDLQ